LYAALLAVALLALPTAAAKAQDADGAACAEAAPAADEPSAVQAELLRANGLLEEGRPAEALAAYGDAERLARAAGDARTRLMAAANGARAALDAGRTDDLAARLERVGEEAASVEDASLRGRVLTHLARTWTRWRGPGGPDRKARLARAAALLERAEAAGRSASDRRLVSYALGHRAALYEEAGRIPEALTLTRRALHEADAARAPDAGYRWQWQLGRLQQRSGDTDAALEAYRRAARTLDELRAEQAGDELRFREDVQPVYRELTDLLLRRARSAEDPARQQLLAEARATLEAFRAAELREYFDDPCLAAQRRALPESIPGTVVLHPIVLPDRLELLVGRGDRLDAVVVPVSGEEFEQELLEFRRLVTDVTTRRYLVPARRLYDWLIRPIAPALAGEDLRALVILPEGGLRQVPLAALQDERTGQYLIEQAPLAIVPGLTLVDPRHLEPGRTRVLAGGIASAVQGFSALEGVSDELQAISGHFQTQRLLDGEFRADHFEAELTRAPYEVVHVASHGEFHSDAAQSFVLAWDRKITMDQLAAMIAKTRFRTELPLELLVLSACESALGDERAALGLAGVALRSGARSAVATLWTINDRASSALIRRFYAELVGGASRAEALRRAQLELLRETFPHPYGWAAFVLISSWL
jgi:CHAT domain-containing protein